MSLVFRRTPSTLSFWLLGALFLGLWLLGGASRPDVPAQAFVRAMAWVVLAIAILKGLVPAPRSWSFPLKFLAAVGLVLSAQLLPLPPAVWMELPGRDVIEGAASAIGEGQPWRPLSMSPYATINALSALIIPLVVLILAARLDRALQWRMATIILGAVGASALLGVTEFAGVAFDYPLINDIGGLMSANFANRNHFALFLAIGCALLPTLLFRRNPSWPMLGAGVGLLVVLILAVLSSGSRAGTALVLIATVIGLLLVKSDLVSKSRHIPRGTTLTIVVGSVALLAGAVWLSFSLGRAAAIDRAFAMEAGADLRTQALPVVLGMAARYFPAGTGYGTFDPVYRISEPDALLNPLYFNHAHNDWLEVLLDGGILGLALILVAVVWLAIRSYRVWFGQAHDGDRLAKLGSAVLLLICLASLVDYPARTPLVMAVAALAAFWLASSGGTTGRKDAAVGAIDAGG